MSLSWRNVHREGQKVMRRSVGVMTLSLFCAGHDAICRHIFSHFVIPSYPLQIVKTDFQLETSPSTPTLCLLSVSHCSIQLIILFPILCDFNLSISLCCGTFSNAFWKSKYIISTGDLSSTHLVISSKKYNKFVIHDLVFRNQC